MSKKEKNEQRHKMAVAIYREMTPEKQALFVEENKQKHFASCAELKASQDKHREMLKRGREFADKNGVMIFHGRVGGYALAAGAMLHTVRSAEHPEDTHIAYKVAYTLCSKKDRPSVRAAKGYVGCRLAAEESHHPYTFLINMSKSGAIIPERLAQLIRLHIELDIVSKRVQVPAKLQRCMLNSSGSVISTLMAVEDIPKTSRKRMRSATKVRPQC